MDIKISVIVPVYNVQKYLRQCLDSIINQSYKNLEIICINDCSTDNSLKILEEYQKKDNRITIINNSENIGLGLTRNVGIKVATGEYIHCLDSDDYLELNAYETMVDNLKQHGPVDMLRFEYLCIKNDNTSERHNVVPDLYCNKEINIYNTPEILKYWPPAAWLKLLNRDFILKNNLYYNNYRCFEDVEYLIKSIVCANSIYCIQDVLINYRDGRPSSLMSKRTKYLINIIKDYRTTLNIARKLPPEIGEALILNLDFHLIKNSYDALCKFNISYKQIKKIFKFINPNILYRTDNFKIINIYNTITTEKPSSTYFYIKFFIKKLFPTYFDLYIYLKEKIKKLVLNAS
ncbi:MAG: glycosyltransferase family 2 protein [Cyanobacteria bacterium SIG28]|nr:glycosyltransferase family 2 protein [Cyanobacteria bacterium SIG28]